MEHTLYRFWEGERLLYVGISIDAYVRASQHRRRADWWPEATHVTFEKHPTREAVFVAERRAIESEAPAYNVAGAEGARPATSRERFAIDRQRRITLGALSEPGVRFDIIPSAGGRVALLANENARTKVDERRRLSLGSHVVPGDLYRIEVRPKGLLLYRLAVVDAHRLPVDLHASLLEYLI